MEMQFVRRLQEQILFSLFDFFQYGLWQPWRHHHLHPSLQSRLLHCLSESVDTARMMR